MSGGAQGARTTRPAAVAAGRYGSRRTPAGVAAARARAAEAVDARRPYLVVAGLAVSFSVFTLLGTLLLRALHLPGDVIRWAGLIALLLLGIAMIVPAIESLLEKPFGWIPQRTVGSDRGGFLLGLALGAVYVPCAGPVLAAITVAGATGKIGGKTLVLTVAFAIGTAIPLLCFALAGRRVAERVTAFRRHQRRIRVGAGVLVIGLAVALTFNVTDVIQRDIPDYTNSLNKAVDHVQTALGSNQSGSLAQCAREPASTLQECGKAPAISGISQWLNTPSGSALSLSGLTGKVVLVDFWAYSCINCQRAIAHVTAWYKAYQADGLQIIGVHTPEYAFEHVAGNVAAGAKRLGITYPIALDNDYTTWNNYGNDSWPAEYLIDATGQIRHVDIGEGDYSTSEALIRQLLQSANPGVVLPAATDVADVTPTQPDQTPETYLGSERASTYAGATALTNGTETFAYPASLPDDQFALTGSWTVGDESITARSGAGIELNFSADDVYLDVGGTGTITATVNGVSTSYPVSGAPDIYTLFSKDDPQRRTMQVTLSPGLSAYSFTFG
jgi:cytochrome c biogenesis protein CcdA/thiol-disulfide isomerase/thioredoxin